jgi:hypothetical protein
VQGHIATARAHVDRLNSDVRDALEGLKKPKMSTVDIALGRDRLEKVTAKWDDDCQQNLAKLNQQLQKCTAITLPATGRATALAESSIGGWVEALDKVQRESQAVFAQDMTVIADDALKAACATCDNQGRLLRNWLRDRDSDCLNSLISEAKQLTDYTSRLCHAHGQLKS